MITSLESVLLRICWSVVDSPQQLQLHLAVGILSSPVLPATFQPIWVPCSKSEITWLLVDKKIIRPAVKAVLKASEIEDVEISSLRNIEEDWDLYCILTWMYLNKFYILCAAFSFLKTQNYHDASENALPLAIRVRVRVMTESDGHTSSLTFAASPRPFLAASKVWAVNTTLSIQRLR